MTKSGKTEIMVTPIRTPHRSKPGMALALLALIAAIAYIVAPIDFDGPIYGKIDDFCFFMAAFSYAQSQFINPPDFVNVSPKIRR